MKKSVTSKKIESVIKNLPTKESPGPDGLASEFYQGFRELKIKLPQTLTKSWSRGNIFKAILWGLNYLVTKARQGQFKKTLQNNILDEYWCKNSQKKKQKNGWPSIPMSSTSTASINHRLKIFEKKIWKIPKCKYWSCCMLATIYIAFTFRYSNYPRDDLNYTGGCTCTVCKDIILYRGLEHPQSLVSMGGPGTHGYWGTTALTNRIQEHVKRIIHHNQVGLFLQCKDGST